LSYFNQMWNFSKDFHENTQYQIFVEMRPVGEALVNADVRIGRRMDGHDGGNRRFSRLRERA
jgi:hypothetical protein